jgi:hypothetical protein
MAMTDPRRLPQQAGGPPAAVEACWMCGIRLPAEFLVPDGGSACADVRWYCVDTWGCTERWTSRRSRPAGAALGGAMLPELAPPPARRGRY